jgi:hypothetical protein
MVTYTNKSNTKQNQVILDFAPNCPCNQPQRRILELNPGETKQVLHPYAAVELVDTFIYYRVACEQPIHMQAELLDPTPFTDASCSTHQEVEWGYKYKHEGTAWYTINTDTLNHTEYTSNISLYNSDQTNTLTVQVAFDCPVNQTMLTNSITVFRSLEAASLPGTVVTLFKIMIVAICLFILYFNVRTVALFAFWKETAAENSPVPQIPSFIGFTTVAGGSAVALTTVMYALSLGQAATELSFLIPAGTLVLLSIAAIVYGLFIFSYKAKIEEFVSADEN